MIGKTLLTLTALALIAIGASITSSLEVTEKDLKYSDSKENQAQLILPQFGGWAAVHLMKSKKTDSLKPSEASPLQVRAMIFDEIYKWLGKKKKSQTSRITNSLIRAANKYELDPILILAMMIQESGVRADAKGSNGEIGLLQLKLPTARWIALRSNLKAPTRQQLFIPEVNIEIGTAYLAFLRDQLGHAYFIHAYNRGPAGMRRKKGDYLVRIKRHYQNLVAALTVTDVHSFASLGSDVENTRPDPLVTLIGPGQGKGTRVP